MSADESTRTLKIKRHPFDWQMAEYRFEDVSGFRWDSESGGVKRMTSYPMVFAYVMCDQMLQGELAHSCAHGPPPHEIKVCLPRKHNKEVWKDILDIVGPKPPNKY